MPNSALSDSEVEMFPQEMDGANVSTATGNVRLGCFHAGNSFAYIHNDYILDPVGLDLE